MTAWKVDLVGWPAPGPRAVTETAQRTGTGTTGERHDRKNETEINLGGVEMATVKVTEVIGVATDREAFDWGGYFQRRRQLPGLERLEVARVVPPPGGGEPSVAMLSEGWFPDLESMQRAHGSRAGEHVRTSVATLRQLTTVEIHVAVIDPYPGATAERSNRTVNV